MPEQLQSTFNFQNNTPPSQSSTQATSPISEPYASPGNRTSSISYQESRRGRSFLMLDQFRSEELHLSRTSNAESSNRNSESHRWTPSGLSPTPAPKDLVPLHTTGKPESLHTMGNRASTTASIVAKNLTQVPENESQSRSTSYRPSTLAPPSLSLDIPNHRFSIPIRLADETERLESRILSPRPPVTPPTITTAILDSFNPDSATSTSTITQSPVHHSAPSSHYPAQTVKILVPSLNLIHFSCYQSHHRIIFSKNIHAPVPCMVCHSDDREGRWKCAWCCLRICGECMALLDSVERRDLKLLVERLGGVGTRANLT